MNLLDCYSPKERKEVLASIVTNFKERAEKHDEDRSFPYENFAELKKIAYPALTVPRKYGGLGISLTEMLHHQETIAKADGSTALAIGWHMGLTKFLGESSIWDENKYKAYAIDVVENGALLNNAATEPGTGSPTRGGKPETIAEQINNQWVINGRKTFTTLAPVLDYFIVSASIKGTDQVGNFLVKRSREGVHIEETWDSIAMKATGSHDLVLKNVKVNKDDLVQLLSSDDKPVAGWLLHIPACYLGIGKAAQEYAVQFAKTYSPNSIERTISELPTVKQRLGEIECLRLECEHFLYSVANQWDYAEDLDRSSMKPLLGAVKMSVVNKAVQMVDLAMRVVGARSLSEKSPLQRYYRDVRAGLHNPPMDDMTLLQLAEKSLD